jgi:DNA-directed RNA polymerase specialized sigma24 family protein
MRDVEAVESIIAGNSEGLAAAYDEYADFIYAYCRSMLGDAKETAEAILATFVIAAARADGLQDRERLRAWLFAIARSLCLRGRGGAGHTPAPAPRSTQANIEIGSDAERLLLRAAIDGLNPPEHDVVSLLWYGLDIDDVTLVLGVTRNQVYTVFSHARDQLEASVATLLVGRHGRDDCHDLDRLLGDWDGSLNCRLRSRVTRHIEQCQVCTARRERELRPALQLSLSPGALLSAAEEARATIPPLPGRIRERLIWLVTAYDPEASEERAMMEKRAGAFGGTGFPKPRPAGGNRRRGGPLLAVGAGVIAAAAVVVLVITLSSGGTPPATSVAAGSTRSTVGTTTPGATSGSPSQNPSGLPSGTAGPALTGRQITPSPTLSASTRAGTSSSAAPSSSATSTTSTTPPATAQSGTISVSPSSIKIDGLFSATLTLTASGGTVNWSVSLPSGVSGEITVSPSSGTLQAGQAASVSVSSNTASSFETTLTVSPGGHEVAVKVGLG